MVTLPISPLRTALLALACAGASVAIHAQTAPPATPANTATLSNQAPGEGRRTQKVENIHVEDAGASVDEVRYGGRTQSINVQPKSALPGYQVLTEDGGRSRTGVGETSSGGNGPRVWNLFKF